ncbi:D-3-phosphoglycerate dehydrogenase SerA [Octadecabacter antarcticus 307]|uniref:D-3-phosphoglycerate dehydrogenase SerA n=1 Tax=Octadecabacter antarcticus 307 TaxID=391626 RepID=M9RCU0_9RHOB|nr:hydroxyacid dehydrogenase [Octadecabacter antarcticus]AGI67645.1 D-3-phosphoglycerate dehydrogenase SerA [Octadecabacter antarcticus 307]
MTHLLVAGKLHPVGVASLEVLKSEGVKVTYIEEIDEPSYADHIETADALVIRTQPLSAVTIARAEHLKVVSRHGVGYDAVNVTALNARGIPLAIVGDVNSVSVAEHAMMQLLAGAKQAIRADRAVRDPAKWGWRNQLEQREISGRNLLIIGYGRAGQKLARMAVGFDMSVCAYDPYLQSQGWPDGPVKPIDSLADALAWADCLSLHVPRGDKPLLDAAAFAQMKLGMIIANTARGGVLCETALAAALSDGRVHSAGLDVFDVEPPTGDMALAHHDNAILSPHIAGLTEEASERMALSCIENAMDTLNGTIDLRLIVNKEALK